MAAGNLKNIETTEEAFRIIRAQVLEGTGNFLTIMMNP